MSKFKSHEEYDRWRSHRALKLQGAKDLEKMDAERPVYLGGTKLRGLGLWKFMGLAVLGIAIIVFLFSAAGKELIGKIFAW